MVDEGSCHYRFSTAEERRRTGAWWVRELEGTIPLGQQPGSKLGHRAEEPDP
jgi:hypothetical protein